MIAGCTHGCCGCCVSLASYSARGCRRRRLSFRQRLIGQRDPHLTHLLQAKDAAQAGGSMAYSEGITTVTRRPVATSRAMAVERSSWTLEGRSAAAGRGN